MSEAVAAARAGVWVVSDGWTLAVGGRDGVEYPVLNEEPLRQVSFEHAVAALGAGEMARMSALSYAGFAAIAHAYGASVSEIRIEADERATFATADGLPRGAAPRAAFALAGQAAVSIYLARGYLRDPLRVMVGWLLAAGQLSALTRDLQEPTAFLTGAEARAPRGWQGRAVHLEHVRGQVLGYLEEHWQPVAGLAEHLAEHSGADLAAIEAAFAASAAPLPVYGPGHAMFQATSIHPEAVTAAADYWTTRLREHLAAEDAAGHRAGNPPVAAEDLERFRTALEAGISVLLERRTPRGEGGLERAVSLHGQGRSVAVVGMAGYEVSPVLASALTAAGLDPGELYACMIPPIELDADGAFAESETGERAPLWTPADSQVSRA